MEKLSTRERLRGNRSADGEAIREVKRAWDKYHTTELKVNPRRFLPSATKRDKAHGDASPSIVVDWGGDSGVHGAK